VPSYLLPRDIKTVALAVVSKGHESSSLTLWEENRLRAFEKGCWEGYLEL
jgi:hypothetical protein